MESKPDESADKMDEPKKRSYVYIVECSDGTFYTGWTTDVEKRVAKHNAKKGAKYTRSRLPVKLAYAEEAETKQHAMRREAEIKRLSRQAKQQLIDHRKEVYGNNEI